MNSYEQAKELKAAVAEIAGEVVGARKTLDQIASNALVLIIEQAEGRLSKSYDVKQLPWLQQTVARLTDEYVALRLKQVVRALKKMGHSMSDEGMQRTLNESAGQLAVEVAEVFLSKSIEVAARRAGEAEVASGIVRKNQ